MEHLDRDVVFEVLDLLGPERVHRGLAAFEHEPFFYWWSHTPDGDVRYSGNHKIRDAVAAMGRPCGCFAGEIVGGALEYAYLGHGLMVDGVRVGERAADHVFRVGYEEHPDELLSLICDWFDERALA